MAPNDECRDEVGEEMFLWQHALCVGFPMRTKQLKIHLIETSRDRVSTRLRPVTLCVRQHDIYWVLIAARHIYISTHIHTCIHKQACARFRKNDAPTQTTAHARTCSHTHSHNGALSLSHTHVQAHAQTWEQKYVKLFKVNKHWMQNCASRFNPDTDHRILLSVILSVWLYQSVYSTLSFSPCYPFQ